MLDRWTISFVVGIANWPYALAMIAPIFAAQNTKAIEAADKALIMLIA